MKSSWNRIPVKAAKLQPENLEVQALQDTIHRMEGAKLKPRDGFVGGMMEVGCHHLGGETSNIFFVFIPIWGR